MKPVHVVSATTCSEDRFWSETPLGQSLRRFPDQTGIIPEICFDNTGPSARGLSHIYNAALDRLDSGALVAFIHDDVAVADFYLGRRLNDAHTHFDVVGVVGNARPDYSEPSWVLAWNRAKYPSGWQPFEHFSGSLIHQLDGTDTLSYYGPCPRPVVLLDGLFISARMDVVQDTGLRFDPRFSFHFYDLDFCRQAHRAAVKTGTWPIALTHHSGGAFESDAWHVAREVYFSKWAPPSAAE